MDRPSKLIPFNEAPLNSNVRLYGTIQSIQSSLSLTLTPHTTCHSSKAKNNNITINTELIDYQQENLKEFQTVVILGEKESDVELKAKIIKNINFDLSILDLLEDIERSK